MPARAVRFPFSVLALLAAMQTPRPAHADDPPPRAMDPSQHQIGRRLGSQRLRCSACFADGDGHVVPFEPVYSAWFAGDGARPKYLLAGLEMAAILSAGTAYYWIRPNINRADWDFSDVFSRMKGLEITFDNNAFATNHVLHPAAGGTYYLFARENELTPFEAFGYSVAASTTFEFFLEWLEKVSINDLIVTPTAGTAAGEFVFQLSEYLNSAPEPGAATDVARYTLGLASAVHDGPRGARSSWRLPADGLGLSSAFWHRFRVAYGLGRAETELGRAETFHRITLQGEINAMPGMLRPGTFAVGFGQGNFNTMRLTTSIGRRGLLEVDSWFQTTLAGHYAQRFVREGSELTGYAAMIGPSVAWRYVDRFPLGRRDQLAVVHLIGPLAQSWVALGGLLARTECDLHLDFGAVRSLGFERYVKAYGQQGMKSVLQNYDYSFVRGASARVAASLEYHGVELGVRRSYGHYRSIQSHDRLQDEIREDVPSHDDVSELTGWIAAKTPGTPLELRLDYERKFRHSHFPPFRDYRTDRSVSVSAGARF